MRLRLHIDRMYREIISYEGSFGDPIETGPYNPFDVAREMPSTDPEREGVGVAMLCYLMAAIDNGTYAAALASGVARQAQVVRSEGLFEDLPAIDRALGAFFESEGAFLSSLKQVYATVVLRRTCEG